MSEQRDPIFAVVRKFETEIGIAPGFLEALLHDGDDWSFVIKLHAFAEAAITDVLTAAVGLEELRDLFRSLSMGDQRRGKLAIAKRLNLLDPRRVAFFRAVGRIRNQFVHDVTQVGRRIEEVVRTFPQQDQDRLWLDVIRGYSVEDVIVDFKGNHVTALDFARANPRFAMWVAAMETVALIYRAKSLDDSTRRRMIEALSTMRPIGPRSERRDSPATGR